MVIAFWNGLTDENDDDKDAFLVNYTINLTRNMGGRIEKINPSKISRMDGE